MHDMIYINSNSLIGKTVKFTLHISRGNKFRNRNGIILNHHSNSQDRKLDYKFNPTSNRYGGLSDLTILPLATKSKLGLGNS